MPTIRIASCNLEWMNDWFTSDGLPAAFKPTFVRDGQTNDTATTATRAAALIRAVDPDLLALQEAPSRPAELELFVRDYLSDGGTPSYQFVLGDSGASQKLAFLYKPPAVTSAQLAPHAAIAALIDPWLADVDGDLHPEDYAFTRTPLVVDVGLGGHTLQVIVMHTKSSFVNNGQSMWNDPLRRQDYVALALTARRRNATEGMRVRDYLDARLRADPATRIVVLGDLNDGPGLDYFERRYLAHNVTDIMVGSTFEPEEIFTHAQHDVPRPTRYTAVFDDFVENVSGKRLLLDHLLLSPGLRGAAGLRRVPGSGAIHHAEYAALVVGGGARRQDRPSDHRPASVRLTY
jgi:endonuclease/exonuclease/phosphatase family metal-dependent hydrolase